MAHYFLLVLDINHEVGNSPYGHNSKDTGLFYLLMCRASSAFWSYMVKKSLRGLTVVCALREWEMCIKRAKNVILL